jgi:F-type H+-transporting ATPase subunit b
VQLHPAEILYIFFLGLLLYIVLRKQLFEPIGRIIQERETFIDEAKSFFSNAEAELLEKKMTIENSLGKAAADAYEIQESLRQEGYRERKEMLRAAQDDAYKMLDEARKDIRKSAGEAEASLRKEAESLAEKIVTVLIGRTQ